MAKKQGNIKFEDVVKHTNENTKKIIYSLLVLVFVGTLLVYRHARKKKHRVIKMIFFA